MERRHGKHQALEGSGGGGVNIADAAKRSANASHTSNKLAVKDRLEEVLYSRLMIVDGDADKLCNEICGQGKD